MDVLLRIGSAFKHVVIETHSGKEVGLSMPRQISERIFEPHL